MRKAMLLALLTVLFLSGCSESARSRGELYQVSTLSALMEGVYEGDITCGELRKRGQLGIGTFDALDGELVLLDDAIYQVREDGKARRADDELRTPFALVTPFQAQQTFAPPAGAAFKDLEAFLDQKMGALNYPLAIRIQGTFSYMKTRCPPRQEKPYKPLAEALANQPTFEFREVSGTLVGFRLPKFMAQINMPGYHLHFLTDDRTAGGHVLDFTTQNVTLQAAVCEELHVKLPSGAGFQKAALRPPTEAELEKVERARK